MDYKGKLTNLSLNPILGNYVIDNYEESPSISEEKLTHKTLQREKAEFRTFGRYICPFYGSVFKMAERVKCFGVRDARWRSWMCLCVGWSIFARWKCEGSTDSALSTLPWPIKVECCVGIWLDSPTVNLRAVT